MQHLITIKQFCEKHPWPSQSAMRAYIYRAKEMGLSEAFVRVGRRVLIEEETFLKLIRQVK